MTSPLISAIELRDRLAQPGARIAVLDTSFDLADPPAGERGHAAGHVPGAMHVHLERDLSGVKTGLNGRHPLPEPETFAARMAALGVDADMGIVVYDGSGGMYAARLWWMLRWAGHADARLLDGGLAAWRDAGGAVEVGAAPPRAAGNFALRAPLAEVIDFGALKAEQGSAGARLIVDARSADRFRGENETLDPVGGRIPGSVNRFFRDNLGADGRFKSAAQLRAEWQAVIGDRSAASLVQQCGSGVTACHNLLALEVAGLGSSTLYPGSWSEWCVQPGAPVVAG